MYFLANNQLHKLFKENCQLHERRVEEKWVTDKLHKSSINSQNTVRHLSLN